MGATLSQESIVMKANLPARTLIAFVVLFALFVGSPGFAQGKSGGGKGGSTKEKLDEILDRLDALEGELVPCTPKRLADGLCTDNHPADLKVTACFDLHINAEGELAYRAEPQLRGNVGLGWPNVADLGFRGHMELPITIGPVAAPNKLGFEAEAGLGVTLLQVCLQGLDIESGAPAQDALVDLFTSIADVAEDMRNRGGAMAARMDVNGDKLKTAMSAFESLSAGERDITDPMGFVDRDGPVRQVLDSLPVGQRFTSLVDDPRKLVPQSVAEMNLDCERLAQHPAAGPLFDEICGDLQQMPRLEELIVAIREVRDLNQRVRDLQEVVQRIETEITSVTTPIQPGGGGGNGCPRWVPDFLCFR
jgi:hypothetical protein